MKKYFSKLFAPSQVATLTIASFLTMGTMGVMAQFVSVTGGIARYPHNSVSVSPQGSHSQPSSSTVPTTVTVGRATAVLPSIFPSIPKDLAASLMRAGYLSSLSRPGASVVPVVGGGVYYFTVPVYTQRRPMGLASNSIR